MIKELVKLANHLDSRGFAKEADYLDGIVKRSQPKGPPAFEYWSKKLKDDGGPLLQGESARMRLLNDILNSCKSQEAYDKIEEAYRELREHLINFKQVVLDAADNDNLKFPVDSLGQNVETSNEDKNDPTYSYSKDDFNRAQEAVAELVESWRVEYGNCEFIRQEKPNGEESLATILRLDCVGFYPIIYVGNNGDVTFKIDQSADNADYLYNSYRSNPAFRGFYER